MRYLHSDSLDKIHPDYDFVEERETTRRQFASWDLWPHQFCDERPYGGILVSQATVGMGRTKGVYSYPQRMHFERAGARSFLQYEERDHPDTWTMGDSGSFTHAAHDDPPPLEEAVRFYGDARFTKALSPDAIIFRWDPAGPERKAAAAELHRYEATLDSARAFIRRRGDIGGAEPVATIQGWNEQSLADAARAIVKMGYSRLAIGGMAPLSIGDIDRALRAVRAAAPDTAVHVLGFGKPGDLAILDRHGVESFDTASPMLRAVKDASKNYWHLRPGGGFEAYQAIRLPHPLTAREVSHGLMSGRLNPEETKSADRRARMILCAYDRGEATMIDALDAVEAYWRLVGWDTEARRSNLRTGYARTLADRPWKACPCRSCREAGINVTLLRSAATNRRRGIHNMAILQKSTERMTTIGDPT